MKTLYSVAQIRELERQAMTSYGLSEADLMRSAGTAVFQLLQTQIPHARRIVVLCGGGNNGGDGYVVAELASLAGMNVTVLQVGSIQATHPMVQVAQRAGVVVAPFEASTDVDEMMSTADVIVDALLGIGLSGDVRGDMADAIKAISRAQKVSKVKVLSVDCPSGLNCDTGAVMGVAVRADSTMTFIGYKKGLLTGAAVGYVGALLCDHLALPPEAFAQIHSTTQCIEPARLSPRHRESHKGSYGHVLVIGGECGMSGAPRMAAEAAARMGAGLVSIATRPEHTSSLNSTRPELMVHGVSKVSDLQPLLEQASVVVIGPGLGQQEWGQKLWQAALACDAPKIVDADGLNCLAKTKERREDWVLTPHPGEAARLLGWFDAQAVQADRYAALDALHAQYGGVSVLKGAGTLVKGSDGQTQVCDKGNPGMATGGMGDVLSGVIAGLVAQGLPLEQAASTGVYLHACAADKAAAEGGERGLLAMDVVAQLRGMINGLTDA